MKTCKCISNKSIEERVRKDQELFKTIEPKFFNRHVIVFEQNLINPMTGHEIDIPSYLIKSCNLPNFINGKYVNLNMEIYNPICPNINTALVHLIDLRNSKINKSAHRLKNELFMFAINLLGPVGDVVEQWIVNVYDFNIHFGTVDWSYNPDTPSIIKLEIIDYKFEVK